AQRQAVSAAPRTGAFVFGRITIDSDVPITRDQAREVAADARQAYAFVERQHRWSRPLTAPWTVQIRKAMKGNWGEAETPNVLRVPPLVLDGRRPGLVHNTFAHELTHLQVWRAAGGQAYNARLPTLLQEGWASIIGDRYSRSLGEPG